MIADLEERTTVGMNGVTLCFVF